MGLFDRLFGKKKSKKESSEKQEQHKEVEKEDKSRNETTNNNSSVTIETLKLDNIVTEFKDGKLPREELINAMMRFMMAIVVKGNDLSNLEENIARIEKDGKTYNCLFSSEKFTALYKNKYPEFINDAAAQGNAILSQLPKADGIVLNPESNCEITFDEGIFHSPQKRGGVSRVINGSEVPIQPQDAPAKFESPKNELEEQIVEYRSRNIETDDFVKYLLKSKAYIITTEDQVIKSDEGLSLVQNPVLFSMNFPEYSCLCIYTENYRATPTLEKFPEFKHIVKLEIGGLLDSLNLVGKNMGIAINPFWDDNLEFNPRSVQMIKEKFL